MKKIIGYGLIAVALVVILALTSKAQLRPCVWPNTCTNAQ